MFKLLIALLVLLLTVPALAQAEPGCPGSCVSGTAAEPLHPDQTPPPNPGPRGGTIKDEE